MAMVLSVLCDEAARKFPTKFLTKFPHQAFPTKFPTTACALLTIRLA